MRDSMAGHDCNDALHELYQYLDGQLTPQQKGV